MLNDLINWRIVFDKDEGAGSSGGNNDNNQGSGDSEIDYSKLDISKIPVEIVAKLPIDLIAKHPEYQKVKSSDEKHRKTNADLRKRLDSDDESGKENNKGDKSDNSDKEDKNDPNVERFTKLESMLGQMLRKENLAEAVRQLNVDDKGNAKEIIGEKHLRYIQGNTIEEMVASGKQVIQDFELDKKNLNSGSAANTDTRRQPFGKIDIQGRMKRKLNNESSNPFDLNLHQQKGGF